MAKWVALKARVDCPECGQPVMLEGPWGTLQCPSCRSETAVGYYWTRAVENAMEKAPGGKRFAPRFMLDTSKPITSFHYAVNKNQPPICPGCDEEIEGADAVAPGTDATLHCPACGTAYDTFPAPRHVGGAAVQIFMGVRESEQLGERGEPDAKPVMFSCTNCGGNLKITTETTRIVTCQYCEVDLFLPQTLWNALHPVRKRRAFWVRTR